MSKQRKWRFVAEGAEKQQGGSYSGQRTGFFQVWYVAGGDGVKFRRCPYTPGGWKVQKTAQRMTISLFNMPSKILKTFQPLMHLLEKNHIRDTGEFKHENQMHKRYRGILD